MEKYSLLETKYLSNQKLKLFKKIGSSAVATDFALINGCIRTSDEQSYYFTKTPSNIGGVYCNTGYNSGIDYNVNSKMFGVRPCIYDYEVNEKEIVSESSDHYLIKKGYYPQKAYDKRDSKKLEKKLKSNELIKTDFYYSTFDNKNDVYYDGNNFFVRILCKPHGLDVKLSNRCKIKINSIVWVKVEPVIWYYDKESKILCTKDVIISGLPFDNGLSYGGDFDNTFISIFLNSVFSKEMDYDYNSKDYLNLLRNSLLNNKIKIKAK